MHSDDVRARFEAWAQREQYALSRLPTGAYADYDTQNAWFGYRAAHADLSGEVRELVEAIDDKRMTLVNAIKRAGGDPLAWSDWTPEERDAITAAMEPEQAAIAKHTHQEKER